MTSVADPASVPHRYTRRGIAFIIVGFVASAAVFAFQPFAYGSSAGYVGVSGVLNPIDLII